MIRYGSGNGPQTQDARRQIGAGRCCPCLHLGMPKTATTCMQMHLFPRHSQIAYLGKYERQGNLYPSSAARALHERLLGRRAPGVRRCRIMVSELIAPAIVAGRIPLFSKEGLTAGGAARKRRQARIFRRVMGDSKIVIVVREPVKFMESMYFQNLQGFQKPNRKRPGWGRPFGKLPRYFTIEQWLDVMWRLPKKGAFGHLLCAETADAYAEVFGTNRVRVFVFERLVKDPNAAVVDLCRFIGVDPEEGIRLFEGKRANDRWTDTQVQRLKQIERSRLRSMLFRRAGRRVRNRMLGFDSRGEPAGGAKARAPIPAEWQQRIVQFARDDHRRLVEQWGLPLEQYGYPM